MTLSSDLGKQIEIDIAYPSRVLMFSAMVENQYQDDIHRRRKRHIYRSHVTAFFAYNSFLF